MDKYPEFIDPYDKNCASLFVRVEHLARYHFAAAFMRRRRLKRVLDCACGDGYGSRLLANEAESVTAMDANSGLIDRGRAADERLEIKNIAYHVADLNDGLGLFEDASFDCVACFETLEHVREDEPLLMEFARVLRRGRWLLLSVPKAGYEPAKAGGSPENPWHLRLYAAESMRALIEKCGFTVEKALAQPYTNISRANMESFRRDRYLNYEEIDSYFVETPESLEFFARTWGWPTGEAEDKSNVIFMICRKN